MSAPMPLLTDRQLAVLLSCNETTCGEKSLLRWQYKALGGFDRSLWSAIAAADCANLRALEKGFPSEVAAYRDFSQTGEFAKRMIEILKGKGMM